MNNVYSLVPSETGEATLLPYIGPAVQEERGCVLQMVTDGRSKKIPIADYRCMYCYEGRHYVTNADLSESQGKVRFVPVVPDTSTTIVFVQSHASMVLTCDTAPRPHFVETKTWIGADGPGLLVQTGGHASAEKQQLFRLKPQDSILFFDANKGVAKLTAVSAVAKPVLQRATAGEVANYVLNQAKERGQSNPRTQKWCFHALRELGCQSQFVTFLGMFPSFKIR